MRIDRVTKAATSDPTIMRVGAVLLHKLGPRRALDISSSMRTLARLQIRLRQHGVVGLGDDITGSDFDKVTEAVEVEGGLYMHDSGRQLFRSPAYVLKAGNGLLRCAQMKRGVALRTGDSVALKEADDYISLHSAEFTDRAASAAHASLRIQGNKLSEFPDEIDLPNGCHLFVQTYSRFQMPSSGVNWPS